MGLIYGVDSLFPSNTRLTNGYNLYEWIMRMSCYPSFWGRNITGKGAINTNEIEFLKSKKCKIAFKIGDFSETEISSNNGTNSAIKALEAIISLGIPKNKNIAVFAEIPDHFSVNHNWMISYARNILANGYIPGFIGNTDSSVNFNFDRQCSHYVQATKKEELLHAIFWATAPKYTFDPEVWAPFAPSEILPKDMHLWQYGTINFHSIDAKKSYAIDSSIMDCML